MTATQTGKQIQRDRDTKAFIEYITNEAENVADRESKISKKSGVALYKTIIEWNLSDKTEKSPKNIEEEARLASIIGKMFGKELEVIECKYSMMDAISSDGMMAIEFKLSHWNIGSNGLDDGLFVSNYKLRGMAQAHACGIPYAIQVYSLVNHYAYITFDMVSKLAKAGLADCGLLMGSDGIFIDRKYWIVLEK